MQPAVEVWGFQTLYKVFLLLPPREEQLHNTESPHATTYDVAAWCRSDQHDSNMEQNPAKDLKKH
jgi:hypothetical protein